MWVNNYDNHNDNNNKLLHFYGAKKRLMSFTFEKIPRIGLTCKLVPVLYRQYEHGLFV